MNCELIWQLRDLALVLFTAVRNVQPRSTIRKHRSQTCRGLLYRKRFMRSNFLQTTDSRSSIRHKTSPTLDTDSSTTNSLDKLSSTNAPVIVLGHDHRHSYVICLRVCYWLLQLTSSAWKCFGERQVFRFAANRSAWALFSKSQNMVMLKRDNA